MLKCPSTHKVRTFGSPSEITHELDTRWPPQVILNYVYAQAAVKPWGTAELCAYLSKVNDDLHAKTEG